MRRHVVWLRADLRTLDHSALSAACADPEAQVAAVYILTPEQWHRHDKAGCQVDFELRTLQALEPKLRQLRIPLIVLQGGYFADIPALLLAWCQQHHIDAVYWNRQYEWNERQRDKAVYQQLHQHGIACHAAHDQCLLPPKSVLNGSGQFYTVYTPFKKNWWQKINQLGITCLPAPQVRLGQWLDSSPIPTRLASFSSHLLPEVAVTLWPAGEEQALQRLRQFIDQRSRRYQQDRDFPALDQATSQLSPYLTIGALSIRQCWVAAQQELFTYGPSRDIDQWLSELGWRDFYKHLLVGFPRVCKNQPFKEETQAIAWRYHDEAFQRWCTGQTGFPLVDAAMRQLQHTGWMHNRLRMVVSMFLTKDLFIDWRWGERFFMQHLIDGDFAANNGGWQWSASTGNDAAPYFRVFNPTLQSQKFDPEGQFIRQYVPELAHLDNKRIHQPHAKQRDFSLKYPEPMVDHKIASQWAIEQFAQLKTARAAPN